MGQDHGSAGLPPGDAAEEAAVARRGDHRAGGLEGARAVLAADRESGTLDLYTACAMGDAETAGPLPSTARRTTGKPPTGQGWSGS